MTFEWPWLLLSLLLLPLAVVYYRRLQAARRANLAKLSAFGMTPSTRANMLGRKRHIPPLLYLVGFGLLLLGLSRPRMNVNLPRVEGTVILAFDVSASMLAEDFEPNRLEAAKEAARGFVENKPEAIRVGIVAFTNGGLIVQQPTKDQVDLYATIDRLSAEGATSLGQGIFTAINAIAEDPIVLEDGALEELREEGSEALQIGSYPGSIILMLTDGENTGPPDPLDVAQVAAEASIRIFPVGIGSPEGTVIEVDGFTVSTSLNQALLTEMANLTNGEYFFAENESDLQEIYENIDLQLTVRGERMEITAILAGLAVLLLLIGGGLSWFWFGRIP